MLRTKTSKLNSDITTKMNDNTLNLPTHKAFEKIGFKHHHGINLPLFSLRSSKGCGVGEFLDLIDLIDWVSSLGFDIIQLLPLNDSGLESSPYNAFSSCALNPIFLSLWDLPHMEKFPSLLVELGTFEKYKSLQRLPYDVILNAKLSFFETYFATAFHLISQTQEFQNFVESHSWLKPYAIFKVLKHENAHQDWSFWHASIRNPSKQLLKVLYKEKEKKMNYWFMIQFFCYDQMKRVKAHANKKNVFLKGDIPILISPQSLDVWIYRKDFNLDFSAGSPPDMFTEKGQNWGFPTFRWDVIEQDDFDWWDTRLKTAAELYDIYRIDHIIGFFRIWAIERGKKAIEGSFKPKDRWAALYQGKTILNHLISVTDMLPIGEDLGDNIEYIREAIMEMGICGTRIPRWERNHFTDNAFVPFEDYPTLSLTTLSTHDSDTLEQWWTSSTEEVKEYCSFRGIKYQKEFTSELRYNMLKESHHTNSLFHINLLGEYLSLFKDLVWENPNDERINVPGIVHPKNWCYRFRPSIDEITSHKDLSSAMKSMISNVENTSK